MILIPRAARAAILAGLAAPLALAALSACAPGNAPAIAAHSTILPLSGPCPLDASAGSEFTAEVSGLRLTVTAADMAAPVTSEGDVGALTIEEVPAGAGRFVGLFGLVGAAPVWRGVVRNVTIEPDETKELSALMARVADLTCSRGIDADRRAFHTATVLKDGTILVVGGAKESADVAQTCGAGCQRLSPTTSAAIYDPTTGSFSPVGSLVHPRMFHTATLLDDGRVVIAGGSGGALLRPSDNPAFPFPIEPQSPLADIEVFDPGSRSFEAAGSDPGGPRVFAASTVTSDGEVIISGGIPAAGTPRNDLGNALDTTTLCSGEPLSCRLGPAMAARRAGHSMFRIDPDGVYVWGGSIDVDSANGIPRFQIEQLPSNGQSFQLLNVAQMFGNRNVFFAAISQYMPFRVLSAGGLVRAPDGTFRLAAIDVPNEGARGAIYVYDAGFDEDGGIAVGPSTDQPTFMQTPRFFGSAAALPGNTRAMIAGGFTDLAFTPSNELEKYDEDNVEVLPLLVGGEARTLREPRGGLVAAANGDGTVVFFGGVAPDGAATQSPRATAEIFADPLTPPEVAE